MTVWQRLKLKLKHVAKNNTWLFFGNSHPPLGNLHVLRNVNWTVNLRTTLEGSIRRPWGERWYNLQISRLGVFLLARRTHSPHSILDWARLTKTPLFFGLPGLSLSWPHTPNNHNQSAQPFCQTLCFRQALYKCISTKTFVLHGSGFSWKCLFRRREVVRLCAGKHFCFWQVKLNPN